MKKGYNRKTYIKEFGNYFNLQIGVQQDSTVKDPIEIGTYHNMVNDAIKHLIAYKKRYEEEENERAKKYKRKPKGSDINLKGIIST